MQVRAASDGTTTVSQPGAILTFGAPQPVALRAGRSAAATTQTMSAQAVAAQAMSQAVQVQPTVIRVDPMRVDTTRGSYYAAGNEVRLQPGRPAAPRVSTDVTNAALGKAHGAWLETASYTDVPGFTPFVANVSTDAGTARAQYVAEGWSPARLGLLSRVELATGATDTLTVLPAQYRQALGQTTGTARVYSSLSYTMYYSTSSTRRTPVVEAVEVTSGNRITVTAFDGASLARVGATWTTGDGTWHTAELAYVAYDATSGTWQGTVPAPSGQTAQFFVQLLDTNWNVGQADNAGLYYQATAPQSFTLGLPGAGWNLVALHGTPSTSLDSATLCDALNAVGGAGTAAEVAKYEAGGWSSYRCGMPTTPFSLVPGKGYFVKITRPLSWSYQATPPAGGVPLSPGAGWTLVALPGRAAAYDAPGLLAALNAAGVCSAADGGCALEVDRWQDGGWEGHLRGLPVNAFALEEGRGYFVRLTQPEQWTP